MILGKHRFWTMPFFTHFREHECPVCGKKLSVIQAKEVVCSDSDEAKKYDWGFYGSATTGDIEVTYDLFFCEFCGKEFTIDYIYRIEARRKR